MTLSPSVRLAMFLLSVGILLIIALNFIGASLPYFAKYTIALAAIALYVAIMALLERHGRKERK